jgi:hypothetical protein
MTRWLLVLVALSAGVAHASPPPRYSQRDVLDSIWRSHRAQIESCSGLATTAGVHGAALVWFRPTGGARLRADVRFTPGLPRNVRRCMQAVVDEVVAEENYGDADDLFSRALFEEEQLGAPLPLLPAPDLLLPAWKRAVDGSAAERRAARAELAGLMPPHTTVAADGCLESPGVETFRHASQEWMKPIRTSPAVLWQISEARLAAFDALGAGKGLRAVRLLDDGWLLVAIHGPTWFDYESKKPGFRKRHGVRHCLVRPDASWEAIVMIETASKVACITGDLRERLTAPRWELPAGRFTRAVATYDRTCAIGDHGRLVCCGKPHGDLPPGTFTDVALGVAHACAVDDAGKLVCWGKGDHGQTAPPAGTYTRVVIEQERSCALGTDGRISCWGGYVGPQTLKGPFTELVLTGQTVCGQRSDGAACWGDDLTVNRAVVRDVQFGDDGRPCGLRADGTTDCGVDPPTTSFVDLVRAHHSFCGVDAGGAVACWGARTCRPESPCLPDVPPGKLRTLELGPGALCGVTTTGTVSCAGARWPGPRESRSWP